MWLEGFYGYSVKSERLRYLKLISREEYMRFVTTMEKSQKSFTFQVRQSMAILAQYWILTITTDLYRNSSKAETLTIQTQVEEPFLGAALHHE